MGSKLDPSVLLSQTSWARALARSLASEASLAEDLVQDAWVAALERPPDLARPVRGWLSSVLRNRWSDLRRASDRRERRERAAASDEAWPSSHELVERAAVVRTLVDAVLDLDEPYRTTVLLRFFEELPQREIARRMRTSTATVNSRLTRALAKLRGRLSRGDRSSWLPVLVPLLREPAGPAVAAGALGMKVVALSIVVAASVIAGLVLWHPQGSSPADPGAEEPVLAQVSAGELTVPSSANAVVEAAPSGPRQRVAVPTDPTAPALPTAPSRPAPKTVHGRVLDETGSPVPGIGLALTSSPEVIRATSGSGGAFEIVIDEAATGVLCADPRYATVLVGSAEVRESTTITVVVAPRIEIGGVVIDTARAPLADAAVELTLPPGFGSDWGIALDYSVRRTWRTRTGPDGGFELPLVPSVAGASLSATLAGYAPRADLAPLVSSPAVEIVLAPPQAATGVVRGVVLDASGARVEGARVSAGTEIARSDDRGEFLLDLRIQGTSGRIVALKAGFLPGIFEPERDSGGALLWPANVVLQLGGPAPTITGRVVDADGSPVSGAKVWLDDPTSFGRTADARLTVETLLRGDDRFWSFEKTRPDGTFSIGGLLERPYRIGAVDPETLAGASSPPVTADDSPVLVRLPTRDVHARVAGRVVSRGGRPIAGARVRLNRITYELRHEDGTDNDGEESTGVVTGPDGAFELRNVPRHGVMLLASGDTILAEGDRIEALGEPTAIELVVSLRLHLQVELAEPRDRVDRLEVFDAQGKRVLLRVFRGTGAHADFEMPIRDGRSDVLAVDEGASSLVLYRGDEVVGRVPLSLSPGPTNVVRY